MLQRIEEMEGGIDKMALGHEYFGAHVGPDNTFIMRQWAPGAVEMWLMGDFNNWNKHQHSFKKLEFGRYSTRWLKLGLVNRTGARSWDLYFLKVLSLGFQN